MKAGKKAAMGILEDEVWPKVLKGCLEIQKRAKETAEEARERLKWVAAVVQHKRPFRSVDGATPRYWNTCLKCVFLGRFEEFDLYCCQQEGGVFMCMARTGPKLSLFAFGEKEEDDLKWATSTDLEQHEDQRSLQSPLFEAYDRAERMGLFKSSKSQYKAETVDIPESQPEPLTERFPSVKPIPVPTVPPPAESAPAVTTDTETSSETESDTDVAPAVPQ